ncbi:MAG: VanZ family protein [Clostridiales bacterium]|nr:VanZ family protein [Clostridiales bacterium]
MTKMKKVYIVLSWAFVVFCLVFIFQMSQASGEASKGMSDSLVRMILNYLGWNIPSVVLRKIAHFCEFAGLCMALFNAIHASFRKKAYLWAFGLTAFYAITDEIHQIFSMGRAGRLYDIAIDWAGALCGLAAAQLIYKLIRKKAERKKKDGNSETL